VSPEGARRRRHSCHHPDGGRREAQDIIDLRSIAGRMQIRAEPAAKMYADVPAAIVEPLATTWSYHDDRDDPRLAGGERIGTLRTSMVSSRDRGLDNFSAWNPMVD
jgi:hypothetical protein